jgi:hypothetical protein
MPGRTEYVSGIVLKATSADGYATYTVAGLRDVLAKFFGKQVSIIVEEVEEE